MSLDEIVAAVETARASGAVLESSEATRGDARAALFTEPSFGLVVTPEVLNKFLVALTHNSSVQQLEGWTLAHGDGHGERLDTQRIGRWLLAHALRSSPQQAVEDFEFFLKHRKGEALKVELIYGAQIPQAIDLGGGVRLVPFETLPPSIQRTAFESRHQSPGTFGTSLPTPVALTWRSDMDPIVFPPDEKAAFTEHQKEHVKGQKAIDDVAALLTLAGPTAAVASGRWAQAIGRGVPGAGAPNFSWTTDSMAALPGPVPIDADALTSLVTDFRNLDDAKSRQLLISVRRLGQSVRHTAIEDAAIDVRTALEVALIRDSAGDKTFRVATYGAWVIGTDFRDRAAIYDKLVAAYGVGSAAVHAGDVGKPRKGVTVEEIIRTAQGLTIRILTALIKMRVADPKAISLGANLEPQLMEGSSAEGSA